MAPVSPRPAWASRGCRTMGELGGFLKIHRQNYAKRPGRKAAGVGSGPAGLAAAAELNYFGHEVTLFERNDRIGGLLRYGIPDFKLEKRIVDRRLDLMAQEGVILRPGVNVGVDIT